MYFCHSGGPFIIKMPGFVSHDVDVLDEMPGFVSDCTTVPAKADSATQASLRRPRHPKPETLNPNPKP